jgi:hypothetical protein
VKCEHGKQNTFFPNEQCIQDWTMLLETQLKFEAWLNKKELKQRM